MRVEAFGGYCQVNRYEDLLIPLDTDLPPGTSPPSKLDLEPYGVHSKG